MNKIKVVINAPEIANDAPEIANDAPEIANDAPDPVVEQGVQESKENRIPPAQTPEAVEAAQQAKHDQGKPRLSLVPPSLIEAVGRVRTYGTDKYGSPDNWLTVEPWRFKDAMMRHLCEYLRDPNSIDAESGLPHLEHLACNVAFLLEFDDQKKRGNCT